MFISIDGSILPPNIENIFDKSRPAKAPFRISSAIRTDGSLFPLSKAPEEIRLSSIRRVFPERTPPYFPRMEKSSDKRCFSVKVRRK